MTSNKSPRATRIQRSFFLFRVLLAKLIGLPPRYFSKRWQTAYEHWNMAMLWVYIKSLGTQLYIDQPCTYKPISKKPLTEANSRFALSEEEVAAFHERGYTGPHRLISEEEMDQFRTKLEARLEKKSKTYGFKTNRDRHLDSHDVLDLFAHPAIVEKLTQLLGPDLLIWRSQVFNQEAGAKPISMHQASTYMFEDFTHPILIPPNRDELFQLTIWIAVDDANLENGCMQFIPGSHKNINLVKRGGKGTFYNFSFELQHDYQQEDYIPVPVKPGEFIIFSERTIHGNPGNRSDQRRMGINYRVVTPATYIYKGKRRHHAAQMQETYDLKKWRPVLLSGQDRFGRN